MELDYRSDLIFSVKEMDYCSKKIPFEDGNGYFLLRCQIDKHTNFVGLTNTYLSLQISKDCLPANMTLPHLKLLALVGCVGIDDDALSGLENECSK